MNETINMLLILCPLIFLAGFIDSIAGGGGLISLPSYIFVGLPVHFAYGTNKFSAAFGTMLSAARFIKSGKVHLESAAASVVGALFGSFLGAKAALALDEKFLKYSLIVLLPAVGVFILTRKGFGEKDNTKHMSKVKIIMLSILSGIIIGAYDGFFGPGTGTFLILIYTSLIGFNLTTASGNAKIVNLASNISALVTFLAQGKVMVGIGAISALFGIAGNWVGSGLAIKNGAKIIKPVFMGVIALLFVKIGLDLIR